MFTKAGQVARKVVPCVLPSNALESNDLFTQHPLTTCYLLNPVGSDSHEHGFGLINRPKISSD